MSDTNTAPADGNWHSVVITKSGTTVTFYVDGTSSDGGGTATYSSGGSSRDLYVGQYNDNSSPSSAALDGSLADVALFNGVLNSTDIGNFMAGAAADTLTSAGATLDHYWKLDNAAAGNESATTGGVTLTEVGTMGYEAATFGSTSQILLPNADVTTTNWAASDAGALYAALDEASPGTDTEYIYTTTLNAECEVALADGVTPATGTRLLKIKTHSALTPAGGMVASLVEGTTVVQAFTVAAPVAASTYAFTVTGAVTDYGNLRVRVKSVA
jgi:hypothetical protein